MIQCKHTLPQGPLDYTRNDTALQHPPNTNMPGSCKQMHPAAKNKQTPSAESASIHQTPTAASGSASVQVALLITVGCPTSSIYINTCRASDHEHSNSSTHKLLISPLTPAAHAAQLRYYGAVRLRLQGCCPTATQHSLGEATSKVEPSSLPATPAPRP